jgi:hypothetical protein
MKYVGIDLHKKTISVCVVDKERKVLQRKIHFANPIGPGWANPENDSFDDPLLRGRDDKPYGPLPRAWAHFKGLYHLGQRVIVSYTVGKAAILETPGYELDSARDQAMVFTRTLNVGKSPHDLLLYHDVADPSDKAMAQPVCWITNAFDRFPSEMLWVTSEHPAWRPLKGSLLNFSYGYGKVYVVPYEKVGGAVQGVQGGMGTLPLPRFPTGVMRGRFHPVDGQLYCCGMFAWAGTQTQPGGFYRVRATGKAINRERRSFCHRFDR